MILQSNRPPDTESLNSQTRAGLSETSESVRTTCARKSEHHLSLLLVAAEVTDQQRLWSSGVSALRSDWSHTHTGTHAHTHTHTASSKFNHREVKYIKCTLIEQVNRRLSVLVQKWWEESEMRGVSRWNGWIWLWDSLRNTSGGQTWAVMLTL